MNENTQVEGPAEATEAPAQVASQVRIIAGSHMAAKDLGGPPKVQPPPPPHGIGGSNKK